MSPLTLDIAANRSAKKYGRREMALRIAWALAHPLFVLSPRPFFSWRRLLLRAFGARVGRRVHVYPSTRVEMPWNLEVGEWSAIGEGVILYSLGRITIGSQVTVSARAHLCAGTHDYRRVDMPLLRPPIRIEDKAWVCTEAYIGPDVVIGEGAVVGARAVVVRPVAPWTVVAGNPARVVRRRVLEGAMDRDV